MSDGESGRPKSTTTDDVLKAIHDFKTVSSAALAKILKVSDETINRRKKELTEEQINKALGIINDADLLPAETVYEVFSQIPDIKAYSDTLMYKRECSQRYTDKRIHTLHRICTAIGVSPAALTPEAAAEFVSRIRKKELTNFGAGYDVRMALRSWLGYKGYSKDVLTNLGVHSKVGKVDEARAHARFTQEQRHKIREAARKHYFESWKFTGTWDWRISFSEQAYLALAMEELFEVAYYTMTRISALVKMRWDIPADGSHWGTIIEDDKVTLRIVDKGKGGGLKWSKVLLGEAAEHFKAFWQQAGKPTEGLVFPFGKGELSAFMKDCYEEAGIPKHVYRGMGFHIWRHTGAQDLLAATSYNYALVAKVGGWTSTDVLEKHYGKMPPEVQENLTKKAMGLPVQEIKREFVF